MKRKTSKEILAESFREVAEKKNIDKITVKDITDNCGYSPATFYRQFSLPASGSWGNGMLLSSMNFRLLWSVR